MTPPDQIPQKKFGTFLGVFLPSILTVLGLIMYLRFGWVVGNLGLGLTIVAVLLANLITFITGLSAAAIATNIKVGVGGVYYLVSRSLGLETGGAIGIAFYISRTLSITFYAFGFAESVLVFWPADAWGAIPGYMVPGLTALIIVIITLVSGKSAELVLKFQVPMLILVVLSILALVLGVFTHELRMPMIKPGYFTEPGGFWIIFAVFFPGVTGFLAGIAMSGDLKTPGKSIRIGVIQSVFAGMAVYLLIPILFGISAVLTFRELADPALGIEAWTRIALFGGVFIYPAAWGAILSSAIGSVLSGPRVLQSLSQDGLAPPFLSRLSKTGQPTIATWITGAIALAAVALGDLNTVAEFVTVLFLTLYVVINLVAAIEKLVAEPSYRPRVNVPWPVSLIGAIGSLYVIYLINHVALLAAVALELGFYIYFRKKALEQQWGDVTAGFWLKTARFALLRVAGRAIRARNWRPKLLLFVQDIRERAELVKLAGAFGQRRGILTIAKLLLSEEQPSRTVKIEMQKQMQREVRSLGLEAFCEVDVVDSIGNGILNISKGHGVAGLKTNTVIFGWSGRTEGNIQQLKIIRNLASIDKNILLAKFNDHRSWQDPSHQRIDIWWSGWENNGDLMLILAYMLKLNPEWEEAEIRIRSMAETQNERDMLEAGIRQSLRKARIAAEVNVTVEPDASFGQVIRRESSEADIVFLGLRRTEEGQEEKHVEKLEELSQVGKVVVFVQNNGVEETMPILLNIPDHHPATD